MLASASAGGTGALVVTTTSDSSDGACTATLCSLRDAVEASNAGGGAAVAVPAGRYALTLGPLLATEPLELDGAGARTTILAGNGAGQVIRSDRSAAPALVLSDLTITGGHSHTTDAPDFNEGGGIMAWGALTLDHVSVTGNASDSDGGGLDAQGDLTIGASTIANNSAVGDGGGIRVQNSDVSIDDSTVADNSAQNRAGVEIDSPTSARISFTTIAGNSNSDGTFGSLRVTSGSATLEGSVVANDLSNHAPNCVGTIVSAGHNLATDGTCALTAAGDLASASSAGLAALADNGGDTDTMLPQAGSAAIDGGGTACSAIDQRDGTRPQGAACDVGSVETSGSAPSSGLTQLAAPNDCIAETEIEGCGTISGAGLKWADWAAVSPDGENVYVASFAGNAVAEFARAGDGSLTELGCIAAFGSDCGTTVPGLSDATSVVVSPDGKNVYVTGDQDDTVMIFDRSSTDGSLTPAGCIQDAAARSSLGCVTTVHGMSNAYDVVVSPDGNNVYVAAGGGGNEGGAVVELARASGGALTQLAAPDDCVEEQGDSTPVCGTTSGSGLLAVTALALSPDGTSLYSVADTHAVRAGDAPGALAAFTRDPATGALTQSACIGEATSVSGITECRSTTGPGLSDLVNVAVSGDGKTVYTASDDPTGPIAEFARAGDGALTSLGCIDSGGAVCATTATGLAGVFGIAVSPDGANVYAASAGSSSFGGATPVAPGIVELARASDGTLTASDCIQQAGAASQTCPNTSGHGLGDALGVAVSPDGANVYVATSSDGGAVAAFSRVGGAAPPPSNQAPTASFRSSASGLDVAFDGSASADTDGTIGSYVWDFGDGTGSTAEAPAHTYGTGGTYTVVLTVTDNGGASASVHAPVTVSSPPVSSPPVSSPPSTPLQLAPPAAPVVIDITPRARVAATPGTGNKRTAFSFGSDGSLGKLVGYAWSFGDGSSASTPAATHVYGSPGTFTVRLTVTDDSGRTSSDETHVVVKNALPVPGFSYRSRVKRAVSFDGALSSDADGRVRAYRWSFGDGAVGAGRTTTHRYRGRKTRYTVTLVVTDDSGARGSIRRSISVRPGAGDVSVAESIVVTDVPGLIPPAGITDIETIGASDGTAPIHHPSPRRLSNQQRRER